MEKTEQLIPLEALIEIQKELFHKEYKMDADFTASAPGRINIIGEHTDYNNGLAMPAAINRWVLISFIRRKDTNIQIKSLNFKDKLHFTVHSSPIFPENWQKYIFGAWSVFKEWKPVAFGFDAMIWGNVPLGSGVSSSAALEVAMMNGLNLLYETKLDELDLVKLCQQVEHKFLQVNSGLLDQYASQFSRKGEVMVLDLNRLKHQYVNMEMDEHEWVLVDSGVKRELAHSGYSERVKETSEAFEYLQKKYPVITNFRDLKEEYLDRLPNELWKKRIRHYISENKRVIFAMDAIQNKDYESLGNLLKDSHRSLSQDYEVSCTELDYLASLANNFEGCLGSRMMGGGFGGCTINLLHKEKLKEFSEYIMNNYRVKFKMNASIDHYTLVGGASIHQY